MNVSALKRSEPNPVPGSSSPVGDREERGGEESSFASLLRHVHVRESQADSLPSGDEKRLHMQAQTERRQLKRLHAERLQERSAWEDQAAQAAHERHVATAARAESIGKREEDAGAARQHFEPRVSDSGPTDELSVEEDEDSAEASESRRHSDDTQKALSPLLDRRLEALTLPVFLTASLGTPAASGPKDTAAGTVGGGEPSGRALSAEVRGLLGLSAGFGGVVVPSVTGVMGAESGIAGAFGSTLASAFSATGDGMADLQAGAPGAPQAAQEGVGGTAATDGLTGAGAGAADVSTALNSSIDTTKNLSEFDLYAPVEVSGMPHAELSPSRLTPQQALQAAEGEGGSLGLLHRVASRNGEAGVVITGGPSAQSELGVLDPSRAVTSLLGAQEGLGSELGSGDEGTDAGPQGEGASQLSTTATAFDARLQAFSAGNRPPTEATDLASRLKEAVGQTLSGVVSSTWEQKDGLEHVSIALNDPELGRIQIELSLQDGKVKLELFAEQELARHALQDHRKVLEQELSRQQYTLEQFKVSDRLAGDGMRDGRGGRASDEAGRRQGRGVLGQVAAGGMAGVSRARAHEGALDIIA